jgi:hypothetical protein
MLYGVVHLLRQLPCACQRPAHAKWVLPSCICCLCLTLLLLLQVWEVQWGRDGYKGTPKVMDLKGHKSQVGHMTTPLSCCCR